LPCASERQPWPILFSHIDDPSPWCSQNAFSVLLGVSVDRPPRLVFGSGLKLEYQRRACDPLARKSFVFPEPQSTHTSLQAPSPMSSPSDWSKDPSFGGSRPSARIQRMTQGEGP
jgi:hypothetical protein